MNSSQSNTDTPQIAVWYFVGATFVFAAPALFFPDAELWIRIGLFAVGMLLIVAGGIQLGRELGHRRERRDGPPPTH